MDREGGGVNFGHLLCHPERFWMILRLPRMDNRLAFARYPHPPLSFFEIFFPSKSSWEPAVGFLAPHPSPSPHAWGHSTSPTPNPLRPLPMVCPPPPSPRVCIPRRTSLGDVTGVASTGSPGRRHIPRAGYRDISAPLCAGAAMEWWQALPRHQGLGGSFVLLFSTPGSARSSTDAFPVAYCTRHTATHPGSLSRSAHGGLPSRTTSLCVAPISHKLHSGFFCLFLLDVFRPSPPSCIMGTECRTFPAQSTRKKWPINIQ